MTPQEQAARALGYSTIEEASRALGVPAATLVSNVNPSQTLPQTLPSLPQGGGATPTPYSLPQGNTQTSPLLAFADKINAAVDLARTRRNKSSLAMMQPFSGTVAASDFNSILSNLNRASDTRATDLTKQALEMAQPLEQPADTSKSKVQYGNFNYTEQDYNEDVAVLTSPELYDQQGNPNRGADGYVNPQIYLNLYKEWLAKGGLRADFLKLYPIKTYINPNNNWPEIKDLRGDKAPATSSGGRSA